MAKPEQAQEVVWDSGSEVDFGPRDARCGWLRARVWDGSWGHRHGFSRLIARLDESQEDAFSCMSDGQAGKK